MYWQCLVQSLAGLLALAVVSIYCKPTVTSKDVELRMPNVQPKVADTYLCVPLKVSKKTYITGFVPHADMNTAHHMLLYGCSEPGEEKGVWNCGEMVSKNLKQEPVCKSGSKIIYAWAMDAPPLTLPEDVAFAVGDDTDIQWLVLQVHYKDVSNFLPPKNGKDQSGLTLKTQSTPLPKRAGVYLMGTGGSIPPHSTTYMETACSMNEPIVMHPFAFRAHAHVHGEVNSGYRIRNGVWTEIGRESPKKPEMFYNTTAPNLEVKKGDILAARCTMVNKEDRSVDIGSTQNDEMCNFYIMYWVNGKSILKNNYCFTAGPPMWNWKDFDGLNVNGIPQTASIVPGTDKILKATDKFIAEETQAIHNELEALENFFQSFEGANEEGNEGDNMIDTEEDGTIDDIPQQRYWDRYGYNEV